MSATAGSTSLTFTLQALLPTCTASTTNSSRRPFLLLSLKINCGFHCNEPMFKFTQFCKMRILMKFFFFFLFKVFIEKKNKHETLKSCNFPLRMLMKHFFSIFPNISAMKHPKASCQALANLLSVQPRQQRAPPGGWARRPSRSWSRCQPPDFTLQRTRIFSSCLTIHAHPLPEGNLFKAPMAAVSPAVKWMFAITPAFRFSKNPGV